MFALFRYNFVFQKKMEKLYTMPTVTKWWTLKSRVSTQELRVYLGVRTCEVFLCFVAIVRVRVFMLNSLFSLFYVTGEFHRFLHRGRARTSVLKSAKASSLFFFLLICMGGIRKLFKLKTRSFHRNLNSQRGFKNHQYFTVSKS